MSQSSHNATVGVPTATAVASGVAPIVKTGTATSSRVASGSAFVSHTLTDAERIRGFGEVRANYYLRISSFANLVWMTDEHGSIRTAGINWDEGIFDELDE